jgi:hypothetical protein
MTEIYKICDVGKVALKTRESETRRARDGNEESLLRDWYEKSMKMVGSTG